MKYEADYRAGFVTFVGKPNVGKSTLLNKLVGDKIAITSRRPQTTRNVVRGIVTFDEAQIVFLDTPGLIELEKAPTLADRMIVEEALRGLAAVDIVVMVADNRHPEARDLMIIEQIRELERPVILAINKSDRMQPYQIEEQIQRFQTHFAFHRIIPLSATRGSNLTILAGEIIQLLPQHPPYYTTHVATDQTEQTLVAELIREKVFELARQEIPYSCKVQIDEFVERENGVTYIGAAIYVEHKSQKGILIGKKGAMIKSLGQRAREDIERRLNCKVYLALRVGVKKNWRNRITGFSQVDGTDTQVR